MHGSCEKTRNNKLGNQHHKKYTSSITLKRSVQMLCKEISSLHYDMRVERSICVSRYDLGSKKLEAGKG
jgi:hypothetical protein